MLQNKDLTPKSFTAFVTTSAAALFISSMTSFLSHNTAVDFECLFLPRQHLIFLQAHKTACGALHKRIKVFDLADATVCLFKDRLYTKLSNE